MDKGINAWNHSETKIKENVLDIVSLLNKSIYMMEAELDRLGRPVSVDTAAQLYTILELCRAFNKTFKHSNGGLQVPDPWHIFSRVLLSHIKTIIETEDRAESSDSEVSSLDSKNEDLWYDCNDLSKLQPRSWKHSSMARWNEELGMAEISCCKGKMWEKTGIIRDGKTYCFLEDTLFLTEMGVLQLFDDEDKLIPCEDIHKKVVEGVGGSCLESFKIYKHLKLLGYKIKRHGVFWSVKHAKNTVATESVDVGSVTEITESFNTLQIKEVKPVFDVYHPNSKFSKSSPGNPMFVLCINVNPFHKPTRKQIEDLKAQCDGVPLMFCYLYGGNIHFFAFEKVELHWFKRSMMGPRWKGYDSEKKAFANPIANSILNLQSLLIKLNPEIKISSSGFILSLKCNPELTNLMIQTCFGQPTVRLDNDYRCFELTLVEAFCLCFSLKCVKIIDRDHHTKTNNELWKHMITQMGDSFPYIFKAYSHLRNINWVVKSIGQYGGDFVAYRHHPSLVHSEYSVFVSSEPYVNNRLRVWSDIQTTVRNLSNVKKTLLVLYVDKNCEIVIDSSSPSFLDALSVEERTITRWDPERCRSKQQFGTE